MKEIKSPDRRRGPKPIFSLSKSDRNPIDWIGRTTLLARGENIFRKGQAAKNIYKVEAGCIRTFVKLRDGRRLILAFYFPGDYFGLEMLGKHRCFAEATAAAGVLVVARKRLVSLADTSPRVAKHLLDITNIELQRAQNHSLLLRSTSDERVARFLLEMTKRDRKKEVDLPMSRQDIADHLDLTIKTVSRALTRLNNASAISFLTQRRVAVHVRKLRVARRATPAAPSRDPGAAGTATCLMAISR